MSGVLPLEIEEGIRNLERVYDAVFDIHSKWETLSSYRLSALAYECMGYHNALEHLEVRIIKGNQIPVPGGASSHKEILKAWTAIVVSKGIEISDEESAVLQDLMGFRHVATHIYGFLIDEHRLLEVSGRIVSHHLRFLDIFRRAAATM